MSHGSGSRVMLRRFQGGRRQKLGLLPLGPTTWAIAGLGEWYSEGAKHTLLHPGGRGSTRKISAVYVQEPNIPFEHAPML